LRRGGLGRPEERLSELAERIISCTRCPRLVQYRHEVARNPPRRYSSENYWAKPLPGFGDPRARIMVIGLAPAAHGGNRTGRMFTGDSAGDTLIKALYFNALANLPHSLRRGDGLRLRGCYVTASVRCPPPNNQPLREELERCYGFLSEEFDIMRRVRVVVALGALAFKTSLKLLNEKGFRHEGPRPVFRHGASYRFTQGRTGRVVQLIAAYHPSRRNTQTGLLTQRMLDNIFRRAVKMAGLSTRKRAPSERR